VNILAMDPGSEESGWVEYDITRQTVERAAHSTNKELLQCLRLSLGFFPCVEMLVIEMVSHYGTGMPVGASIFDTCVWIGRFIQAWGSRYALLKRQAIKAQLCGNARAKDANVRQALIDRFPPTGGGKTPQMGTKNEPGPLFGMKGHLWAALAVAVCYAEQHPPSAGPQKGRESRQSARTGVQKA